MNIKTKLSVQFTLIVAVVLLFFSILVYYFSYTSQIGKFRENLFEKANNSANLLLNVEEVDSLLLKKIHQSTVLQRDEEIALTDSVFNVIYSNNIKYLTDKNIKLNSYRNQITYFSIGEKDGICYRYQAGNHTYRVYVMAFDRSRMDSLAELRRILIWSILSSISLSVLLSYFFSQRAMMPISRIIRSVKEINSLRLSNRVEEGNRRDEIAQLAITFNDMLRNLEIAFSNQRDFVSNASHELRTPLTVMIGESDYILSHDRSMEEYQAHIKKMVNDLRELNSMLNSLLELAQVSGDTDILFSEVRIDEVVYSAIFQVQNKYPGRKIVSRISYPDNPNDLVINGNEGLLTIAFNNLLDNACKFSHDEVITDFSFGDGTIIITVSDNGIGIPGEDLEKVCQPFTRASNVRYIGGFGIGLSLVSRIINLHGASMQIESKENEGTRFILGFSRKS